MMPNIVRGGDAGGLVAYLFGPGRNNEHADQHIVASSMMMAEMSWGVGDRMEGGTLEARACGADLEAPVRAHDRWIMRWARRFNHAENRMEKKAFKEQAHVWHCSLSLHPDEPHLSDETWNTIAREFMEDMGFGAGKDGPECRWIAVRHGTSKGGGDHIHIAATTVREDGKLWRDSNDFKRSQQACNRIEKRHGLVVVSSRERGIGSLGETPVEQAQARKDFAAEHGKEFAYRAEEPERMTVTERLRKAPDSYTANRPLTRRGQLETLIRAASQASSSEAEFVEELGALGVLARPRFDDTDPAKVVGFSVCLDDCKTSTWMAPSRVARDLSLPRLRREMFADSPEARQAALEAWKRAADPVHVAALQAARESERSHAASGEAVLRSFDASVAQAAREIGEARTDDELSAACRVASGYFAVMSVYCRSGGWQLANASRMLARAGTPLPGRAAANVRVHVPRPQASARMLRQGLPAFAEHPASSLVLLAQTVATLLALRADKRETDRYVAECRHAVAHLKDIAEDAQALSRGMDPAYVRRFNKTLETPLTVETRAFRDGAPAPTVPLYGDGIEHRTLTERMAARRAEQARAEARESNLRNHGNPPAPPAQGEQQRGPTL